MDYNKTIQWCCGALLNENNKKISNVEEKLWGNKMINTVGNNQWTTQLGETIVYYILQELGKNPRRPSKNNLGYRPDWETDDAIWEVKTRNWTTSGTAGEKVFGTPYKYCDIPDIYKKPLKIVCVAYQEYEFTHGKTKIFSNELSDKQKVFLNFYKEHNIEFVQFTKLIDEYRRNKSASNTVILN